jgi:hypothetical protein
LLTKNGDKKSSGPLVFKETIRNVDRFNNCSIGHWWFCPVYPQEAGESMSGRTESLINIVYALVEAGDADGAKETCKEALKILL